MHLIALTSALILGAASPSTASVERSFSALSLCKDLQSQRCLIAVSELEEAGPKALQYMTPRFSSMSALGQMLALSIYGGNPSTEATIGLSKLVLNKKLSPSIRGVAIQTLAERFDGRRTKRIVRTTLMTSAKDKHAAIRAASVRALGNRVKGGDSHIINLLRRAAGDEVAMVRSEAILGLAMSRRDDVSSILINALRDPVMRVRIAAADGLSFVKSESSLEPLIACLQADEGLLRRVASEALTYQTGLQFGDDYLLWREWLLNR